MAKEGPKRTVVAVTGIITPTTPKKAPAPRGTLFNPSMTTSIHWPCPGAHGYGKASGRTIRLRLAAVAVPESVRRLQRATRVTVPAPQLGAQSNRRLALVRSTECPSQRLERSGIARGWQGTPFGPGGQEPPFHSPTLPRHREGLPGSYDLRTGQLERTTE